MNHKALQLAKNEASSITEANGPHDCHSPDVTPMTKEFREYADRVHEHCSAFSSIPQYTNRAMEDTAKDGMWEWRAYAACSDTQDYAAMDEMTALSHTLGREDPEVLALISSRFGVMSRAGKRARGAKQTSVHTTRGPKHIARRVNDKARAPQLLLCH